MLLLPTLPLGCGKSSKPRPNGTSGTSGESGSAAAGAGGALAGEGGRAGTETSSGGSAGAGSTGDGGSSASTGGESGEAGAISTSGGTNTSGTSGGGGSSGTAGDAGAPAAGSAGTCTGCVGHEACWSGEADSRCVASSIPLPNGLTVDTTEVTRGQYAAWLATAPVTTGQPAPCDWNTDFSPDPTCMAKPSVCPGDERCETHPQPCIDFCDAAAYCTARGARLCTAEEWLSSCSADGMYPGGVGPTFVRGACNDYTVYGETTTPVASLPDCQSPADSGFAGVFDMIGNVAEWVDDCNDSSSTASGATDVCNPRGLSFGLGAAAPSCDASTYAERSEAADNIGFRCCSTP
ncbi:MAG TPA: SUMF1/EgtB/PvdO family nonheme iron enzyme [Polyangiaceae bacterium]